MKERLVKRWMTAGVVTVPPEMTLPEAGALMAEKQVRRLPVVDEDGRLMGIVTRGDVRGASPSAASSLSIWEVNYLLARLTVAEIMTANLVTAAPGDSIGLAVKLMTDHKISGLPVVDENGRLVGIITESDIFRLVSQHWQET